ncbi:MAG: hypothetical protein SynsKO_45840 [Synoicihabitans sp.]
MNTTFKYGIGMATASFVIGLLLFFAGFHSSADKIGTAQTIAIIGGLAISIGGLIMVMKARREEYPAEEGFSYGRALGTGTLTSLWSAITGGIYTALYASVINPGLQEVVIESEIAKMEEQGLPASAIDQAEGILNFMTSPAMQAVSSTIGGFVFGFIFSLVIAAAMKRAPTEIAPPPIAEA